MPTRIMNWNIQKLGRDKALAGDTTDLLNNIAKVVVFNNIDIFVVLEVNTVYGETAEQVVDKLSRILEAEQKTAGAYRTYILSPNTGKEFYAFFIKNSGNVVPLTVTGGTPTQAQDPSAAAAVPINFRKFAGNTDLTNKKDYFPLIKPDIKVKDSSRKPRNWTAVRLPCLALFEVTLGGAANQILAIVCCHFAANDPQAKDQIGAIRFISLLRNASGVPLQVQVKGANTAINNIILTGDFNVHFTQPPVWPIPPKYYPLTKTPADDPPGISHVAQINAPTHLVTLKAFNGDPRPFKNTDDLPLSCYDNFFVSPNLVGNVAVASSAVVDVPNLIKLKRLTFDESLDKYAGKKIEGVKGVKFDPYSMAAADQNLRKGTTAILTMKNILIGAQLISDHLPVVMQVN